MFVFREQRNIDGDEGRGKRTLTEKILKNVGNSRRRIERVSRIGLQTEVMCNDADPDHTRDAAQQDPHSNKDRRHSGARTSFGFSQAVVPLPYFTKGSRLFVVG